MSMSCLLLCWLSLLSAVRLSAICLCFCLCQSALSRRDSRNPQEPQVTQPLGLWDCLDAAPLGIFSFSFSSSFITINIFFFLIIISGHFLDFFRRKRRYAAEG
ncbi:hypothetical protein AWENTII_001316 [Aspergillus wentii]